MKTKTALLRAHPAEHNAGKNPEKKKPAPLGATTSNKSHDQ